MEQNFPSHVSAAVLAKLLSINTRTIAKLVAKGVLRKTPGRGFDVIESIAAHRVHCENLIAAQHGEGSYGRARTAWVQEKAATAKLSRLEKENTLIHVNLVADIWGKFFVIIRTACMRLPVSAAPRLVNLKNPMQAQAILTPMIREILEELPPELNSIIDERTRRAA